MRNPQGVCTGRDAEQLDCGESRHQSRPCRRRAWPPVLFLWRFIPASYCAHSSSLRGGSLSMLIRSRHSPAQGASDPTVAAGTTPRSRNLRSMLVLAVFLCGLPMWLCPIKYGLAASLGGQPQDCAVVDVVAAGDIADRLAALASLNRLALLVGGQLRPSFTPRAKCAGSRFMQSRHRHPVSCENFSSAAKRSGISSKCLSSFRITARNSGDPGLSRAERNSVRSVSHIDCSQSHNEAGKKKRASLLIRLG